MSLLGRFIGQADRGKSAATSPEDAVRIDIEEERTRHVWEMLDSPRGTHLEFLRPDYAPIGLIEMIADEPRLVLDVGCYCGATGALIKHRWPNAVVIGIEPLAEAAARAAPLIDRVINSTLEAVDFDKLGVPPRSFDVIVFADVLEHMYNPWLALQTARELLAESGNILASIPNVRNLGLIRSLVEGRWKYEGGGLLDITHIRFFTLIEIRDLFTQTGYEIIDVSHKVDPAFTQLWDLEADKELISIQLGPLVINNVTQPDRKEFATLQHFIRAKKAA
jgi:SAM-dependent methyltransferase